MIGIGEEWVKVCLGEYLGELKGWLRVLKWSYLANIINVIIENWYCYVLVCKLIPSEDATIFSNISFYRGRIHIESMSSMGSIWNERRNPIFSRTPFEWKNDLITSCQAPIDGGTDQFNWTFSWKLDINLKTCPGSRYFRLRIVLLKMLLRREFEIHRITIWIKSQPTYCSVPIEKWQWEWEDRVCLPSISVNK